MRVLLSVLVLAALPLGTVYAQAPVPPLRLPVRYPGGPPQPAPAYQGDILEIRLAPRASATARRADPTDTRRDWLGVPDVDAVARGMGRVWFEPEFLGETSPPAGSDHADFTSFYIAHLPRGLKLEDALARFRSAPGVASAQPIAIMPVTSTTPNDSLWASAYWFYQPSRRDLHAPEAWDVTTGDTSIVVAIVDTGVLPYHPDLGGSGAGSSGQIWTNWAEQGGVPGVDDDGNGFVDDVHGWDFVDLDTTLANRDYRDGEDGGDPDDDPNDFAGHGTEVAGLVGALTNNGIGVSGTSWKVRLMPLRMGWSYTNPPAPLGEGEVRMDFAAQAIRYATRMGANVINCSWENVYDGNLWAAVDEAVRNRITIVVAGGNSGGLNDLRGRPDVISVAATNSMDAVASFSTRSPENDLAAPGVAVASTSVKPWATGADSVGLRQPGYDSNLYGTSFSAPLVSGAVALLDAHERALGRRPLHAMGVLLRLWETADDIGAQNPSLTGQYGAGRLDLERLLAATAVSTATPTGGASVGAALVLPGTPRRVAFVTDTQRFVVLDGGSRDTVTDIGLPAVPVSGLAGADLGGGRGAGLFFGTADDRVEGVSPSGRPLPNWPKFGAGAMSGGPALGDLDGDGTLEVVCGASDGRLWAWHADGPVVTGFPRRISASSPLLPVALSDLDGLPGVEIVAVAADGTVEVVRGDGSSLPGWQSVHVAADPSPPSIASGDASSTPVIVIAAGTQVHALTARGNERPGFPVAVQGFVLGGRDVALGDIDGDGRDEAIVVTSEEAHAIELDGSGLEPPGWPRPLGATDPGSPVLGQLVADGAPELLVQRNGRLLALSSAAESLAAFPKPGGAGRYLTLSDLEGDGATDVVAGTGPDHIFYVYSAGPGSRGGSQEPWPTYRGNFARTGSRLYQGTPLPGGGPPVLSFTILGNPSRRPVVFHWSAGGAASARQEIRIHDLMGRRVAVLDLGSGTEGLASWDGLDRDGHRVRAGVYLARFNSGSKHRDARVVLIP